MAEAGGRTEAAIEEAIRCAIEIGDTEIAARLMQVLKNLRGIKAAREDG